jgi:UDP-glucuronate 4-epimerase
MSKILVTGAAGFIGFHVSRALIRDGHTVVGLDCLNDYYDPAIKLDRLAMLGITSQQVESGLMCHSKNHEHFRFIKQKMEDREALQELIEKEQFDAICHLAAQAGVRYSIENPFAYIDSNITGFMNLIEACRRTGTSHLVYASSSSVYGLNSTMPLSTRQGIAHPVSMYAATKKSNELMAHTYSHLFGLPTTGLRFFTVYGPWGRPDMALFLFTTAILNDQPIDVYNFGEMMRDFTYIDDIVEGILLVLAKPPAPDPAWDPNTADPSGSSAPYRVYNIGNSNPVSLIAFIHAIEKKLGRAANMNLRPLQPGDVVRTFSDVSQLSRDTGYSAKVDVTEGISRFVDWYLEYFGPIKDSFQQEENL